MLMDSVGMLPARRVHHFLGRQSKFCKRGIALYFLVLVLVTAVLSPSWRKLGKIYLAGLQYGKASTPAEKGWETPTTSWKDEWESHRELQDEEEARNWAGLQRLREQKADGSLWWDEKAAQLFLSKLEKSQFPTDCSQSHWVSRHQVDHGITSILHIYQKPQLFVLFRGHTLVQMTGPNKRSAFQGCGPSVADENLLCFFNLSSCEPQDDPSRFHQIMAFPHDRERTTFDEYLMQDDGDFSPRGVTNLQVEKFGWPPGGSRDCFSSSSFSSFSDAYMYRKLSLWGEMGRYGKNGVVTNSGGRMMSTEPSNPTFAKQHRVDMMMASIIGSWMLNQLQDYVKNVADHIMSRYMDESGRPLWKSPVVAIHIRQTDKEWEDPYFAAHQAYRPVEDYSKRLKEFEDEFGFRWGSVFIISDSGTAMEALMKLLKPNFEPEAATQDDQKPYIMYDWATDRHLVEKYKDHSRVPKDLKHDAQTHFLASLYIVKKIADHALVTFSSNVGRFIGEQMAAKHRHAFPFEDGPFVTSLDDQWSW